MPTWKDAVVGGATQAFVAIDGEGTARATATVLTSAA